jgi:hypothetical protein
MNTIFEIYEPSVTTYDRDSTHTACAGERCKLDSVFILDRKPFAVLINSQNNKLNIPYDVFKEIFHPSKNQLSPL